MGDRAHFRCQGELRNWKRKARLFRPQVRHFVAVRPSPLVALAAVVADGSQLGHEGQDVDSFPLIGRPIRPSLSMTSSRCEAGNAKPFAWGVCRLFPRLLPNFCLSIFTRVLESQIPLQYECARRPPSAPSFTLLVSSYSTPLSDQW